MSSGRSGDPSAASTEEGTQSMLTIWGRKNSSNVRKALWCAEEAGPEYRTVDAGGAFGLVDEPAFRAMNPNGRVPVIEDDGFVLWESNAIVRYLAARYAPGDLYPQDPVRRADADKWMDWTTSTLAGPFRDLFWGNAAYAAGATRRGPDRKGVADLRRVAAGAGLDPGRPTLAVRRTLRHG